MTYQQIRIFLRGYLNKTNRQIAADTGYSAMYISDILRGKYPLSDKFRNKITKTYPSLKEYIK